MLDSSNRDEAIIEFVADYLCKYGYAPSYDEIGEAVGLNSKSSIFYRIENLKRQGRLITRHEGSGRALTVPGYRFVKTPKPVIVEESDCDEDGKPFVMEFYYCPKCNRKIHKFKDCENCGQLIDWSDQKCKVY